MTIHKHILKGCAPVPLAHYLKALGILRLIGEQADSQARGWWEGERFCLLTRLSSEELRDFFLYRYEPTPIFNPWGGRSGYYPGSPEKTARNALALIEKSTCARLSRFRQAITLIKAVIHEQGGRKPAKGPPQDDLVAQIRSRLRGPGSAWLDTVIVTLSDSIKGPAILGTGGNEGSGSYTAAFLAAVNECIVRQAWNSALESSLWGGSFERTAWDGTFCLPNRDKERQKNECVKRPFRQYLPGAQGSPWDLLLAFEGTIVIQSGVGRRSQTNQHSFLTSPYYFEPLGVGAGSSSEMDEFALNQGRKMAGRGEQWFPLWNNAVTHKELLETFREGRCATGRGTARTPLSAARAVTGFGSSRGITEFIRYGYLQRDNQASHFAVPLGRIRVNTSTDARLVDDLLSWLERLHRTARKKEASESLKQAYRQVAESVLAALTHAKSPDRWQQVLLAAVELEALQSAGTGLEAGPIPPLRPEWVAAVDDNSPEWRLAVSLASAYVPERKGDKTVRHHWLPLEPGGRYFKLETKKLAKDPRVVMFGRDPLRDLSALVERQLVEAAQTGERRLRLVASRGCEARLADLADFVAGTLDLDKLFGLACALMAVKWNQGKSKTATRGLSTNDIPDEGWLAVRLCHLPWPLNSDKTIPADSRILRLLTSGQSIRAIDIALRRLESAGIQPPLQAGVTDETSALRWAASLAFPISRHSALRAVAALDPCTKRKEPTHASS